MTKKVFCSELVPLVLELRDVCKDMTYEAFTEYREAMLDEARRRHLSLKFINAVFDVIGNNIFRLA